MNLLFVNGFTLFGLEIKFYGIIMACAFIIATLLCIHLFKKKNYYSELPYTLLLIVFPSSILGARLYYVLFSGTTYTFAEFFAIWNGGLAIYGGIIGALIALTIYCSIKKINLLSVLDVIAPCVIIAQALGRWGNFFNQEAYGNLITNETLQFFPYGVFIESVNEWHQATFFYESVWNLFCFLPIMFALMKTDKNGFATGTYLVSYGIGRIFIEGLRTDSLYWGSIRISQLISAIEIIIGLILCVLSLSGKLQASQKSKPFKENLFRAKS